MIDFKKIFSYNPETGVITRLRSMRPAGVQMRDHRVVVEHLGKRINARHLAVALQTGEWPKTHHYKFTGADPRDLCWKNFFQRVVGDSKVCSNCKEFKLIAGFPMQTQGKYTRRSPYCKACTPIMNSRHSWGTAIKKKYGVTPEEYHTQLEMQGGGCAICGDKQNGKRLAVDHCHKTGRARAILCVKCNTGLGAFKDKPKLLLEAAKYLLKYS